MWWALLHPTLVAWRAEDNGEGTWVEFEWLARRFADIDRKAGRRRDFSEAYIRRLLLSVMETNNEALRAAEAMRSIFLRPEPKTDRGQRSTSGSRSIRRTERAAGSEPG